MPWAKPKGGGIEGGKVGESDGGKMDATVFEHQLKKYAQKFLASAFMRIHPILCPLYFTILFCLYCIILILI